MSTETLNVPDISCGHCKSSIEGAVAGLDGIRRVEVGIDAKQVDVDYDDGSIDLGTIIETIEAQGYAVAK